MMRDSYRALEDGTQAIRLNPKFAQAYANRGLAYLLKDNYDRVIADWPEAIRLAPDLASGLRSSLADVYYKRGLANEKLGRQAEAKSDFGHANELRANRQ